MIFHMGGTILARLKRANLLIFGVQELQMSCDRKFGTVFLMMANGQERIAISGKWT